MDVPDKAKAVIGLIKEHESFFIDSQLNTISSLLIHPCPNAMIIIFVFSYVCYCQINDRASHTSFGDVNMFIKCHHLIKKIKKNMAFQPDLTPLEILEIDQRLFNIFSGVISGANQFLYNFYYIVVDQIENNVEAPRYLFIAERIHWHYNSSISHIDEFLSGSFGYDRPDGIVVLTLLSKDVISYDVTAQQIANIEINCELFSELNARHNLVNSIISEALKLPDMYGVVIQKRLIKMIFEPIRIIRALLFIAKIVNSVIAEDEVHMQMEIESYNLSRLTSLAQNSGAMMLLPKIHEIKHVFFGNFMAFERIQLFFWTPQDKRFLKNCGSAVKVEVSSQTLVSSQREAHWDSMFNLFKIHKDAVIGKDPNNIIHQDVVIKLRMWYNRQKRNYKNGLLPQNRYNALVSLIGEDIFINYKINDDIHWMQMFSILVEIGGYVPQDFTYVSSNGEQIPIGYLHKLVHIVKVH